MPGALLRAQAWLLKQGGPESSGLNNTEVNVSLPFRTVQQRAGILLREVVEAPRHLLPSCSTASTRCFLSRSLAAHYHLYVPARHGATVPSPLEAQPQRCTQPIPPHLSGQNVFTWHPQVHEGKEKWTLGDSLRSATPGQGVGFPENGPGSARRKRGPATHLPWPRKCEECCMLHCVLGCPQVCVAGGGGGTLKALRSLEEKSLTFDHKAIREV